jgi:NOL1/NOP2/fmu family ribosome biogenesis protein
MWPHHSKGEGHFAVRMIKGENAMPYHHDPVPGIAQKNVISAVKSFLEFGKTFFANEKQREFENIPAGRYDLFGNMLYLLPEDCPDLKGIKVVRAGLCLGEVKKDRFEPDHALSMSLRKDDVRITVETAEMVSNPKAAEGYLRGETLSCDGDQKGWGIAVYHGLPLGFVKVSGGTAKNHYPKGLRKDLI